MDPIAPKTSSRVAPNVFEGVMWAFVALATCFLVARISIKLRILGRLLWDDYIVILAWMLYLSHCVLWKLYIHLQYDQYEVLQGKRPFDQTAINSYDKFLSLIVPQNTLFYSSLWAVKFSFLAFFYKLVEKIRSYQIWWWVVLVITAGAYISSIGNIQWECTTTVKPVMYVLQVCGTLEKIHWANATFYANCATDVLTDCLILSIPVTVLWHTRVPLRKKIVLISVFGATVGVMIISIIRVAVVASNNQNVEIIWLYFWSVVEVGIALIIANIASFRQLFVATTEGIPDSVAVRQGFSTERLFSFLRAPRFATSWGRSHAHGPSSKTQTDAHKSEPNRAGSEEAILPLEFITVQKSYDISRSKTNDSSV